MIVAGVDCSSKNIAITLMTQQKVILESHYVEATSKNMDLRLNELVMLFENLHIFELPTISINLMVVENPVYLSNPKASSGIAQVIGYVKSTAARHGIDFLGVDNMSWKKAVLGNGHSDKEMIMKFALSNWGEKFIANQDIADSACVALWGVMRTV